MSVKVAIIDYGMGNLYSVRNTFVSLGISADIIEKAGDDKIFSYDKLILPGVGAFGDAMKELKKRGFIIPIKDFVGLGRPLLGICLGMQLLLDKSEESRSTVGLGIIQGVVKKFSSRLKCPHMGWNAIEARSRAGSIFKNIKSPFFAYFCHSYYARPAKRSAVIGETEYGIRFASMIQAGRVYGMQFHPEKSQEMGIKLLRNFITQC